MFETSLLRSRALRRTNLGFPRSVCSCVRWETLSAQNREFWKATIKLITFTFAHTVAYSLRMDTSDEIIAHVALVTADVLQFTRNCVTSHFVSGRSAHRVSLNNFLWLLWSRTTKKKSWKLATAIFRDLDFGTKYTGFGSKVEQLPQI